MNKITGQGRPTIYTKGNKGDIYTDINTGIKYECLGPDGFVGTGDIEKNKYDWKEIKSAGGGGGVSSWNDLTDKPFSDETTRLVCCENQTIDIVETSNPSGTYYSGRINGLGEFGTVTGSDMSAVYDWNVKDGDKIVIVIDGTEYEDIIHGSYVMYSGNYELKPGTNWAEKSDNPFYIGSNLLGFEICMPSELVGTHTISIYAYAGELKQLDEKFIPDTIARKEDIPEPVEHTWEALPDKPFGEESRILYFDYPTYRFFSAKLPFALKVGVDYSVGYAIDDGTVVMHTATAVEEDGQVRLRYEYGVEGEEDYGSFEIFDQGDGTSAITSISGTFLDGQPTDGGEDDAYEFTSKYKIKVIYANVEDVDVKRLDPKFLPEHLQFGEETVRHVLGTTNNAETGSVDWFTCETLVAGQNYTVIWDGVEYPVIAKDDEYVNDAECVYIGNLNILYSDMSDTGEPFLMYLPTGNNTMRIIFPDGDYDVHEVVICVKEVAVTPLDEKFMPTLTSPNGTKYKLTVSDDGALTAVQI